MRDVIARLSAAGQLPSADRLVGVPSADLDAWEQQLGVNLPTDYRSFMEIAGATTGARLLRGAGFFWPACLGIREEAQEELEPEAYAIVPNDALFVLEHQGYIFIWLDANDPAAPAYVSQPADPGTREVKRIADSFREFLLLGLDD